MTNKMTKMERVIKWAVNKRIRTFSNALREIGQTEAAFKKYLNRMQKEGFITYKIEGRKIFLSSTKKSTTYAKSHKL